jgi:uncharacterized protein (DUF924 family)
VYTRVLDFWFSESSKKKWFSKDLKFDANIKNQFENDFEKALKNEFSDWRSEPLGRLAEIILLDQFPRNMYRGSAKSFSGDPLALTLAMEAVLTKADETLNTAQKAFLYMPYMHSESLQVHNEAVKLFSSKGLEFNLDFELKHKKIIERFGRFPHRNEILGRISTAEEIEFLQRPGSSF